MFNDQVNESVQNFDSTVNTALKSSLDFVDDAQMVGTHHIVMAKLANNTFM